MSIKGKCKAVLYGSALSFGMGYVLGGLRYGNGPFSLPIRPFWHKWDAFVEGILLPIVVAIVGIVVFAVFMALLTRLLEAWWRRTHRMP